MLRQFAHVIFLFLTLNAVSAAAQECDSVDNYVVDMPVPNPMIGEIRRSLTQFEQATADTILIGDSMVRRWPTDLLQQMLGGGSVANYGLEGDKVQNVRWRLETIASKQQWASRIVLWIGTNNLIAGEKPCAVTRGLDSVVIHIRRLWPDAELVVIGIPPRGTFLPWRAVARAELSEHLRDGQFRLGYRFLDVSFLACRLRNDLFSGERTKLACPNFIKDMMHISDVGYARLTTSLGKILSPTVISPAPN